MNLDKKEFRESPEGKKYHHIGSEVIRVFAICLLMVFVLFRAEVIMNGVSWLLASLRSVLLGLGIGYILNPLDNHIRRVAFGFFKKHNKKGKLTDEKAKKRARAVGVSLASLFGIGIIVALILLIIPAFIDSVSNFSGMFSSNLDRLMEWLEANKESESILVMIIHKAVDWVQNWIEVGLSDAIAKLSSALVSVGSSVLSYVMDFLIAFFVAIYALLEKETFAKRAKKSLFAFCKPEKANTVLDIVRHSNEIFGDFMTGKILDSMLIGVICFFLMTILGIPYAVLVSVVIAVTNIIPFLGPFLGGIPCGAIILLASPQKGIVFIIMFIILQQVDGNIIGPWILGDRTGASAFWIIFSLMFFKTVFGIFGTGMSIVGMIVGVPLFCVIEYFFTRRVGNKLEAKGMNDESVDFRKVAAYDTEAKAFTMLPPADGKESLLERIKEYVERQKAAFRKLTGKRKQKKDGQSKQESRPESEEENKQIEE